MTSVTPRNADILFRYGYALRALVVRDIKARYGNTILGLGWAVAQPLMLLVLYTFVFSVIMKLKFQADAGTGNFALYLTAGMFPFMALSEGVERATTSLRDNRNLLEKVRFPAEVVPMVGVFSGALTELLGLVFLIALAPVLGVHYSLWLAFLPVLVLLRIAFTTGIAWFVSVLNVFVTDLGQVITLIMTAWMFLTPIFYPAHLVPERFIWLVHSNPLYQLVAAYRAVILEAASPLPYVATLTLWVVSMLLAGLWLFRKTIEQAKDFI